MKKYATEEKIGFLYESSITQEELIKVNKLLSKFNEDDIELINQVCDINFKVGFRVGVELIR